MRRSIAVGLGLGMILIGGCSSPPPATRPLEGAPPPPERAPQGQWLRNRELTSMWSGPTEQPGVISFGETSACFCVFEARDDRGDRLHVFNPYSQNYFWIDKTAVDPVAKPEIRPHATKPAGQNCADAIFGE
jgi:hypothetical protein